MTSCTTACAACWRSTCLSNLRFGSSRLRQVFAPLQHSRNIGDRQLNGGPIIGERFLEFEHLPEAVESMLQAADPLLGCPLPTSLGFALHQSSGPMATCTMKSDSRPVRYQQPALVSPASRNNPQIEQRPATLIQSTSTQRHGETCHREEKEKKVKDIPKCYFGRKKS